MNGMILFHLVLSYNVQMSNVKETYLLPVAHFVPPAVSLRTLSTNLPIAVENYKNMKMTTQNQDTCIYDSDCFIPYKCCEGLFTSFCCKYGGHGKRIPKSRLPFPNITLPPLQIPNPFPQPQPVPQLIPIPIPIDKPYPSK